MEQLTLLSAEVPAKDSQSQENRKDLTIPEAPSRSPMYDFLMRFVPLGSCGKTSRESSRPTGGGTLEHSSVRLKNSGITARGEFWTLSMSESTVTPERFHSGVAACSLSDILQTGDIPPRYFLSRRACEGLLRRAEARGKQLPKMLEDALVNQIREEAENESTAVKEILTAIRSTT